MKVVTAKEAAARVESGWTVACAGFVGAGHAEAVTTALEQRFVETAEPRDLTLVYSAGQGDRKTRGVNHFGNPGMTRVVCGGHWRSATRLQRLALDEQIEAYSLPQGVVTHLYRAIAGGQPGVLTRVGLHTFVDPRSALDPRYQGGALNRTAVNALAAGRAPWVEGTEHRGEEFLFYPSFPIHCAFIRATASDPRGNLSTHDEAFHHELLALAQATHNSGGIVVAQVKTLVPHHDSLRTVHVPGILVDYVVVSDDPLHHQMTFGEDHNPTYLLPWRGEGPTRVTPTASTGPTALADGPPAARVFAQRRAVLEIQRRAPRVVNLGVGMPALIGGMAQTAGLEGFTLTVEAGPSGGTPADGPLSFGASSYPESVVDQPAQFDFYDGGGIDLAVLGMAELDARGDVNVSRFGTGERALIAGVGGFINITQGARAVVFVGTLTAGGLRVAVDGGELRILAEGHSRKIVRAVSHLSFNAAHVTRKGTPVLYITERAVFETRLGADNVRRLTLVEIAPGLELQRDVLDQCEATVAVSPELRTMDPRIFAPGPFVLTSP